MLPFIWTVVGLFFVFAYICYWYQRPQNFPPGPFGIPGIGYLPIFSKRPYCVAHQLVKKYGPILTIRFASRDMVFLNDYDSINKAGGSCAFASLIAKLAVTFYVTIYQNSCIYDVYC